MEKLLTIVVPVYKVEQYINKCLDSLILSDEWMDKLEVIIVNDGTPDNSAELSREYTKKYPNTFRQIDKENGGHGSAWNVGVKEATGKYLRFLDSDDWLTNLDKLMEKLEDCDVDLVFTHKYTYLAEKGSGYISLFEDDYDCVKSIEQIPIEGFRKEAWYGEFQKATYKTKILKSLHPLFIERVRYDDAILYCAPILASQNYIVFDIVIYNYYIGRIEQSVSLINQIKFADQRLLAYTYMCDFFYNKLKSHRTLEICKWIQVGMYNDIFPIIVDGNYLEAKKRFVKIEKYHPQLGELSKIANRFSTYPFFIAYMLENFRRSYLYYQLCKLLK